MCAKLKHTTPTIATTFKCDLCKGDIRNLKQQDITKDNTLLNLSYLGVKMLVDGDCIAALSITAHLVDRMKYRECEELLYGKSPTQNKWNCTQNIHYISNVILYSNMVAE